MSKTPTLYDNFSADFQIKLSEIIDDLGFTQKEFSEYVGVSQPVINRAIKYGIIPSTKILIKIANTLSVSIEYILGKTDNTDIYLSDNPSAFHTRLEFLKDERNVTYGKIAQKMTFSKNYFYEWQRLKTFPSINYLEEIAKYFKVSIDYLVGRTDDRNN